MSESASQYVPCSPVINPSSSLFKNISATENERGPLDSAAVGQSCPKATGMESTVSADLDSAARAASYYDRLDRRLEKLESRVYGASHGSVSSEDYSSGFKGEILAETEEDGDEPCDLSDSDVPPPKPKDEQNIDVEAGVMSNPVLPRVVPKVKECDWEQFVNRFSKTEDICAIEALLAGPELEKDVADEEGKRGSGQPFRPHVPAANPFPHIQPKHRVFKVENDSQWLRRIRIQSLALLGVFGRVSGYAWSLKPHTFVRPFKYLIFFHQKFKDELQRMEIERQTRLQEVNCPVSSFGENLPNKISHSTSEGHSNLGGSDSLDDLRCYVHFAEENIIPLYNRFQDKSCSPTTKIRFEDLWYLFRPGELIYMPKMTLADAVKTVEARLNILSTGDSSHESSMHQQIWRLHVGLGPTVEINLHVEPNRQDLYFQIWCHYLDYDGTFYRPITHTFRIPNFKGEREITELEFYPLRFASEGDKTLCDQRQQGQLFTERISQWHLTYQGWTFVTDPIGVSIPDTERGYGGQSQFMQKKPDHVAGEVIVDFTEAFNSYPAYKQSFVDPVQIATDGTSSTMDSPYPIIIWESSNREWVSSSGEVVIWNDECDLEEWKVYLEKDPYLKKEVASSILPEGDDLALLPPRLFVYSLQHQIFVAVNVHHLNPIPTQGSDAFAHLQLPADHKRMIQAAVYSHFRRNQIERRIQAKNEGGIRTQDFILGKGRGLLIMLHGEPGVGKTATAEAVSQSTKRPLFPISCSSLQNYRHDKSPEERIIEVFRLAHLWDCVLLMDEADVFLASRSLQGGSDSEVSGMSLPSCLKDEEVLMCIYSVFLRVLEYYNGILFLTTNRIGKIDPAISSRIHIILHYRRLGRVEIENIFRLNIKRLEEAEQQQHEESGEPALFIVEDDVLRFAADHCKKHPNGKGAWNGRQIRNAFVTAASLARYEAEAMSLKGSNFQPQLRYFHFQEVEKLINEYNRFRANVLGGDDSRRARLNEERDDDYDWDEEDLDIAAIGSQVDKARQKYQKKPQQSGLTTTSIY